MISNRLKAIAKYIDLTDKVIDIGTDHGLLPIYLAKENICNKIIATDINEAALNNAKKNIKKNKLSKKIKVSLSDGLKNVDIHNFNAITISGMGTNTIKTILTDNLEGIEKIIIQSNNEHYELRKFMNDIGFYIQDETITFDNKKYYTTICFSRTYKYQNKKRYLFGIIKKDNINYYHHLLDNYLKIYNKIPSNKYILRYRTKRLIKYLKKIINKIQKKSLI